MKETTGSLPTIAGLQNVVALDALVIRLQKAHTNLPRMGVFFGRFGYGKTYAATFAANTHAAYHVQVGSAWTRKYFCKAIMLEMGLIGPDEEPKKSIPDLIAIIARQLALSSRILIVDDAQYLAQKNLIEIVRDIYEASQSPLILIGEEGLPSALKRSERVSNRVYDWVQARPCDLDDCAQLAAIVCGGLIIHEDLMEKVLRAVGGCARRIVNNLSRIQEFAAGHSLTAIGADEYTGRIDTGDPVRS